MITAIDIETKTFKSGIGYDKRDVDTFFAEVVEGYERLYKENIDLQEKLQSLTNVLQNYKTIEKSLQKALVLAQKAAEETKETAKASAEAIETDAHVKAQEILANARGELDTLRNRIQSLKTQYKIYKAQYGQMLKTQLELLEQDSFEVAMKAMKKEQIAKKSKRQAAENTQAEAESSLPETEEEKE